MGTRCTVKIEGLTLGKIYKHYDGYPEGMLPWLNKFNLDFAENRGDDPDYKLAQLLRSSVRDADEFNLDKSLHTGYGIVEYDDDCGEEYEYTLHIDGTVSYKEV